MKVWGLVGCGMLAAAVCAAAETVPAPVTAQTIQGALVSVDLISAGPKVRVQSEDGATVSIFLNNATTTVWEKGNHVTFLELRKAKQVRVRYAPLGGRDTAKVIEIL